MEGQALLDVQLDLIGIGARVADGEVLPAVELEVVATHRDDDRTVDRGCVDHRTLEDEAESLQHRVATVFGGLEDPGVAVGSEGDAVRPLHPGVTQLGDRHGGPGRIVAVALVDLDRVVWGGLCDAGYLAGGVAVEHRPVLCGGDLARGSHHGIQVRRLVSAVDGIQLGPAEGEGSAQLDVGLHLARRRVDTVLGSVFERLDRAQGHRRCVPPVGAAEVDQSTRGEEVGERPLGLGVDLRPCGLRDGGEVSKQVIHDDSSVGISGSVGSGCGSLRLPMPSEPSEGPSRGSGSCGESSPWPPSDSASCSTSVIGASVNR